MEKAEVLNVFASVFSGKFSTWVTEGEGGDWENEELLTEDDQVQDHLRNLKVHKPTGPDALHPQVLRELVEEAAKPLTIHRIWELRQSNEVPTKWKRENKPLIFKKRRKGKHRELQASLTLVS